MNNIQYFKKKALHFSRFVRQITDKYCQIVDLNQQELENTMWQIETATNAHPVLVARNLTNWLGDYLDQIIKADEKFFTQADLAREGVESQYLPLCSSIQKMWTHLNKSEKQEIQKHFKLVFTVAVLATENQELLDKINEYRSPDQKLELS